MTIFVLSLIIFLHVNVIKSVQGFQVGTPRCSHGCQGNPMFIQQQRQHRDAATRSRRRHYPPPTRLLSSSEDLGEWTSDFDGYVGDGAFESSSSSSSSDGIDKKNPSSSSSLPADFKIDDDDDDKVSEDDEDALAFSKLFSDRVVAQRINDKSACQTRQLSLGPDFIITDYVGNLGFDEVTDWEYYYENVEDSTDRQVVQPNPLDPSKPRRTRTSSGSVVRIFRGELTGSLGGMVSAQGLDRRILIKEFTGDLALSLARNELNALSTLQSTLVEENNNDASKDWNAIASARSVRSREDNANVAKLMTKLASKKGEALFLGLLGECNLSEILEDRNASNDFYRALGVPAPKPDAVWLIYEYAGLNSLQAYTAVPPQIRRLQMPVQRGFFGTPLDPPKLPPFEQRAKYIVQGIMKQSVEALAMLHECGYVHRSIGRSSLLLSSRTMDKRDASTPFQTMTINLSMKLADFGFAGPYSESTLQEDFLNRAKSFQLYFQRGESNVVTTNFAIAEDMHALGFVFLGLLLTCLAEFPPHVTQQEQFISVMPATDEDSLQRLLGEIFDKDVKGEFRDYVQDEEVWSRVVQLLDEQNGAGWTVLETLLGAREKAAASKDTDQIFSVRGLLSNPFFNQ